MTDKTIIPAHPDWYVASFVEEEPSQSLQALVFIHPIIAWELERDEYGVVSPWPITLVWDMNKLFREHPYLYAIKRPDGFFSSVEGVWMNEKEAIEMLGVKQKDFYAQRANRGTAALKN
jgi:hypothetical protein